MPATTKGIYQRGRAKEYRIVKKLRKDGFDIAQRSAGSHSAIDIFAISREKRIIKFVQSKPETHTTKQIKELENEFNWINDIFQVKYEVI